MTISFHPEHPQTLIEVICGLANAVPFKSCSHLSHVVRSVCVEVGVNDELLAEIEDQLGVGLEIKTQAEIDVLIADGLMPAGTVAL